MMANVREGTISIIKACTTTKMSLTGGRRHLHSTRTDTPNLNNSAVVTVVVGQQKRVPLATGSPKKLHSKARAGSHFSEMAVFDWLIAVARVSPTAADRALLDRRLLYRPPSRARHPATCAFSTGACCTAPSQARHSAVCASSAGSC